MPSDVDTATEPRDRTKWLWFGVAGLFCVAVAVFVLQGRVRPNVSTVHVRHILIACDKRDPSDRARAHELAKQLRQRLADGESFTELAKQYSNDALTSANGGDLGYVGKGMLDPDFDVFVWKLPVGQISDVVETGRGYEIIEVLSRTFSKADLYEMELDQKARERLLNERQAGSADE